MNIRFYNAKILTLNEQERFDIINGELWVKGDMICYVGESKNPAEICTELQMEQPAWEREIDVKGNLLMPGFKNAHAHTYMTFLRSYAGVCLEGAIVVLACIIFSLFAGSPPVVDTDAAAVTQVWSYVGELIFNMLVLVGLVKMSDRVVKEMMGL